MREELIMKGLPISGRLPMFTKENRQKNRDGLKTMTRRLMKKQPASDVTSFGCLSSTGEWQGLTGDPKDCDSWGVSGDWIKCPYGRPGQYRVMTEPLFRGGNDLAFYHDDGEVVYHQERQQGLVWRWKKDVISSLFMPMEAARFVYMIEEIKVERLGDISRWDAKREGCPPCIGLSCCGGGCESCQSDNPVLWFSSLWDSIHGPGSWERDKVKWVWAIEYLRVS